MQRAIINRENGIITASLIGDVDGPYIADVAERLEIQIEKQKTAKQPVLILMNI